MPIKNGMRNFFEISVTAEKPLWLRQHGNAVRSCRFVFLGYLQIRKIGCDQTFRGRRFFALADKGNIGLFQGVFKGKITLRKRKRLLFYIL